MPNRPFKTRILMVCLGNICRSPLAHGILKSLLPESDYFVDSAGTASYHVGSQPDPRSIEVAKQNTIDITSQRARQFSVGDFDKFDIIYAMDHSNYSDIISLARNNNDIGKVKLILEENPNSKIKNVPDPYYGGNDGFTDVFSMLHETCTIISNKLNKGTSD